MKRNSFFNLFLPSVILFLLPVRFAGAADKDLQTLISLALTHNPQMEIARQQINQARGQLTTTRAAYLPRISTGAGSSYTYIRDLTPEDKDTVINANINGTQLLYDFGKTGRRIDAVRYNLDAAGFNLKQTGQKIIFQVKQAYYSLLEKIHLVSVAEQSVATYKKHLYRAGKYYEAGVRTRIDITNAELELANAQLDLLRARSDTQIARTKLEQVTGVPLKGKKDILNTTILPLSEMIKILPPPPPPLESLLETAQKQRPELQQVAQQLKAAGEGIKQVKAEYWPTVTATALYEDYETDLQSFHDQWQIGAGLTWEIFSGFETEGKLAEARGKMREINGRKNELELAVIQDVTDAFLRAGEHWDGIKIADMAVKLAEKNLDLAEGRYKAGLGDMIEFNDAQLNLTRSRSNLIGTYFSYLTALAAIELATGTTPEPARPEMK
ncbi:TolC family protein [Desulfomarina sp.]